MNILKRIHGKKIMGGLLSFIILFALTLPNDKVFSANMPMSGGTAGHQSDYDIYISGKSGLQKPESVVHIDILSPESYEGQSPGLEIASDGQEGLLLPDEGFVQWSFTVDQPGLYQIEIQYFQTQGKGTNIERQLSIDGVLPFAEARSFVFPRIWGNEKEEITEDDRGNQIRPIQVEKPMLQKVMLSDYQGYHSHPFEFAFTKGIHTLRLTAIKEPMLLISLQLKNPDPLPTYKEALEKWKNESIEPVDIKPIRIQGEDAILKTSPTLYPLTDRSSSNTVPSHPAKILLNTIGGYNWRMPGDWIEWQADVPRTGLYFITVKYRQNSLRDGFSGRKLYVDGQVQFEELQNITFDYDRAWKNKLIGPDDETGYYIMLEQGRRTIRFEVVLGDMVSYIRRADALVYSLNEYYRNIIMLTGTVPDSYRDYNLEKRLPEIKELAMQYRDELISIVDEMKSKKIKGGSETAALDRLIVQLGDMAKKPNNIPRKLSTFKTNIGGLASWVTAVSAQALEIDYIDILSNPKQQTKPEAGFFETMIFQIEMFISSFFTDYSMIGNVANPLDAVSVWIPTGRDQANIIKMLADEMLARQYGFGANIRLVDAQIILPSIISGKASDIILQMGSDIPVNYGMRRAVADLYTFEDFDMVKGRFRDSSFTQLGFDGKVYALPETQTFQMLFYRKDILEELDIEVPKTWNAVVKVITELQKNNMEFGIPFDINTYAALLFQNGGEFYKEQGKFSGLDTKEAVDAFITLTEFHSHYRMPLTYDFLNRFRTGEMPIGIADFTFYNSIYLFAPELRGMWSFVPIPGIAKDNEINRSVNSSGLVCMVVEKSSKKQKAWEFLKWWTSKEVQLRYGREMENIMGTAGRYPTANIEAFEGLPWTTADFLQLQSQWEFVRAIPEVPGGYFTPRHVNNALRSVVLRGKDARETLLNYVIDINNELGIKRKELGYE